MFFGRRREIQQIADHLERGDSILLIGERRIGKTFLLYMIRDLAAISADFYVDMLDRETGALLADIRKSMDSCCWPFVDMLRITTTDGFYFNVLAELLDDEVDRFVSLSPIDHMTFAKELSRLSENLSNREQRAVVLVDECEKLCALDESEHVLSCLKSAIQQCDAVNFLLAGDIKPHQQGTPGFANLQGALRTIYLAPLEPDDAKGLIEVPVKGRMSFEDLALQRILELTGSKPSLIQILCGHLYERVAPDEDTGDVPITLSYFDQLWETELRVKVFESFEGPLWDFFEGLQGDEQSIFAFLAHNPFATEEGIADALGIQPTFVRRALYTLHRAHRIHEAESGYRISARVVEEFGSRVVPCPDVKVPESTPPTVYQVGHQASILSTNLKHHAEEIAAEVKRWKGVKTQEEIESWLLMFDDHERDVALKLLGNTKYYGQRQIDKRLKVLHGKFLRTIAHRPRDVWFFGVGGPSKSGQMLLYRYRAVNGLSEDYFKPLSMLPAFAAKGIRALAFVDDFMGTGNQLIEFWHEELSNRHGIERAELYCLVLFAFESAVESVRAQSPFDVVCVELLDERDRVFSRECTIFSTEEERIRAEEICRQHGEVLWPECPLGYDDSQALIAFDYQTPNNSLPILWSNAKNWIPIFERKA